MNDKLIYLASPYSHPERRMKKERYWTTAKKVSQLMAEGHHIYSPILHYHPVAEVGGLPTTWDFWRKCDEFMLEKCDELWVLRLDGWQQSVGIHDEILYAESLNLPIKYIDL